MASLEELGLEADVTFGERVCLPGRGGSPSLPNVTRGMRAAVVLVVLVVAVAAAAAAVVVAVAVAVVGVGVDAGVWCW